MADSSFMYGTQNLDVFQLCNIFGSRDLWNKVQGTMYWGFPTAIKQFQKISIPTLCKVNKNSKEGGGEGALKSKIFKGNVKGAGENYKKKNVKMTKPAVQLAMTANLMASVVSYSITLSVFSHHVFV